jgi:hypothetical protein
LKPDRAESPDEQVLIVSHENTDGPLWYQTTANGSGDSNTIFFGTNRIRMIAGRFVALTCGI